MRNGTANGILCGQQCAQPHALELGWLVLLWQGYRAFLQVS